MTASVAAAAREAADTAIAAADRRAARVTYWTGWLSPSMEGCSKEVFALRDHFSRSRIFGLSRYYQLKISRRDRYIGLNTRLYPLFRALAPLFERSSDIGHIYGGLGEWFFLRALGRRPLVLTIATESPTLDAAAHRSVSRFVVHATRTRDELVAAGFDGARIREIHPGVNLRRFAARPRTAASSALFPGADPARFRILFATTPNTMSGLESRGVLLLREAARRLPDVDFILPWRPWAGSERLVQACRTGAPANFHAATMLISDMRQAFAAVDATAAPFLTATDTKICPTSLIESLACGRPILVSTAIGMSDVVRRDACGEVFEPTVDGLCAAIEALRGDYLRRAVNARRAAERHFDLDECMRRHEQLYHEVLAEARSHA